MSIGYFRDIIKALNQNMYIPHLNVDFDRSSTRILPKDRERFAQGLINNTTLKILMINIDIDDTIAYGLRNNTSIRSLTINTYNIKTNDDIIPKNTERLKINLHNANIYTPQLISHIAHNPTIVYLIINCGVQNYLYTDDIHHILDIFSINRSIKHLDLRLQDIKLSNLSIQKIMQSGIKELSILYGTTDQLIPTMVYLINNLSSNKNIIKLHIGTHGLMYNSSVAIGDQELAQSFEHLFITNHTLESLTITNNNFTNIIGYGITNGMKKNNSIHYLNLSDNKFSEEIYIQFANLIKYNKMLHTMVLYDSLLGKDNVNIKHQYPYNPEITLNMVEEAFANALIGNKNLVRLEMDAKRFSSGVIFNALQYNHTLEGLSLLHNNFKNNAIDDIINMIVHNYTLKRLILSYGRQHEEDINRVASAIKDNTSILDFDMGFDGMGRAFASPYLKRNKEQQRIIDESMISKLLTNL